MFEIGFLSIILLLLWFVVFVIVMRLPQDWAAALRLRLVTLLGCVVALGAYFSQAWIEFNPIEYITPSDVLDCIPEDLLAFIVEKMGSEQGAKILRILADFMQLNGWQTQVIPTYSIATRVCTLFAPVLAFAALLWIPFGVWLRGKKLTAMVGGLMIFLNGVGSILLLLVLPDLDALGMAGDFHGMLLATLVGAHLGNGPWWAIIGMLLIAVGGVVEIMDHPDVDDFSNSIDTPVEEIWSS
ncbi:MAG: hypothetical protein JXA33_10680 [Anaerolineae bacterium]|nr:hypothetical protein [Anaerolineae bacterium]